MSRKLRVGQPARLIQKTCQTRMKYQHSHCMFTSSVSQGYVSPLIRLCVKPGQGLLTCPACHSILSTVSVVSHPLPFLPASQPFLKEHRCDATGPLFSSFHVSDPRSPYEVPTTLAVHPGNTARLSSQHPRGGETC